MLSSALKQKIIQRFPANLAYCFAYGSGVKKQSGYNEKAQKEAMIDLIVCVDDPHKWHGDNLKRNPSDYSILRFLGPSIITNIQLHFGANVYCNTLVPIDSGCTIKYSVIATEDLCDDLYHWTNLYVAGRLHKPVETLIKPTNPEIIEGITENFNSAIRMALLTLPAEFSYFDLFYRIAGLSYTNDFRMYFGEKKTKVKDIVEPQLNTFLQLYAPHLKKISHCVQLPDYDEISERKIEQNKSRDIIHEHIQAMPTVVKDILVKQIHYDLDNLADKSNLEFQLTSVTGAIVWRSSIEQSAKNIPTAGLAKALRYSWRKALKTFSK